MVFINRALDLSRSGLITAAGSPENYAVSDRVRGARARRRLVELLRGLRRDALVAVSPALSCFAVTGLADLLPSERRGPTLKHKSALTHRDLAHLVPI